MNQKIGIWIDHRKAVIVFTSDGHVTAKTVESEVGRHVHYSNRTGRQSVGGPRDGGGEKGYEERYGQRLHKYYDDVIGQLGQPESVLIFGPGEAKLQLRERLGHSKSLSKCVEGIETADKLTDAQIVAMVKEHYGISLKPSETGGKEPGGRQSS